MLGIQSRFAAVPSELTRRFALTGDDAHVAGCGAGF
jgi:hypothetical protein